MRGWEEESGEGMVERGGEWEAGRRWEWGERERRGWSVERGQVSPERTL